jgi:hypothetical protein
MRSRVSAMNGTGSQALARNKTSPLRFLLGVTTENGKNRTLWISYRPQ